MRSSFVPVTSLVAVLILLVGNASKTFTEEVQFSKEKGPFNCYQLMMKGAKSTMKSLTPCSKEIKAKSTSPKEYADKLGCIMKCAMHRIKLVNDQFRISNESIAALAHQFSPSEFMAEQVQLKITNLCAPAAAQLDPSEEYCKSYADYVLCLQSSMEDFLNNSPYCIKRKKKEDEE